MKKLVYKFWNYFSIIVSAFALINLQGEILPTLVRWKVFFVKMFSFYEVIKKYAIFPIHSLLKLFDFEISPFLSHYLFLGTIVFTSYCITVRVTKNAMDDKYYEIPIMYLMYIFIWPLILANAVLMKIDPKWFNNPEYSLPEEKYASDYDFFPKICDVLIAVIAVTGIIYFLNYILWIWDY